MKKYITILVFIMIISLTLLGCDTPEPPQRPVEDDYHECFDYSSDWIDVDEFTCNESGKQIKQCIKCGELIDERTIIGKNAVIGEQQESKKGITLLGRDISVCEGAKIEGGLIIDKNVEEGK